MRATLVPHPTTSAGPLRTIEVELDRQGLDLWLRYVCEGDVDAIAWPLQAVPGRGDALWQRTCFEAFVMTDDGYREYNLSPSGRWATYRFSAYRADMSDAPEVATVLGLDGASDMVALEARIELPHPAGRLGLSAVIEAADGTLSYWALAHPSDKPDFHHPDSFVLDLP